MGVDSTLVSASSGQSADQGTKLVVAGKIANRHVQPLRNPIHCGKRGVAGINLRRQTHDISQTGVARTQIGESNHAVAVSYPLHPQFGGFLGGNSQQSPPRPALGRGAHPVGRSPSAVSVIKSGGAVITKALRNRQPEYRPG